MALDGNTERTSRDATSLREQIARLRSVDNVTNLACVAKEYLCIAAVMGGAIVFCECRGRWGLSWGWGVLVVFLAVVMVGALQHRLAALGHEASHYILLKNKSLNDLVGDVFCMFPILATVHFYRLFHLAHHQYTNDPKRDPDLVVLGQSKMVEKFPMSRWQFIKSFYLRPLVDLPSFLAYQMDYFNTTVLGRSDNIYLRATPDLGIFGGAWPRLGAALGWAYILASLAVQWVILEMGRPAWLLGQGLAGILLILGVVAVLPDRAFHPSPLRRPLSARSSARVRLGYYTGCFISLGLLGSATSGKSTAYFFLLWVLPMLSTFFYFMLLRDVYQHTNADDGRLTNTRVFIVDPFTRWAVFVYGQDMHVPHHLYPGVPHHRLPLLHKLLRELDAEYGANVVECHGTFANRGGFPTILDTLTGPRADRPTRFSSASSSWWDQTLTMIGRRTRKSRIDSTNSRT
ncbi:fatty acid desaturase family protein [Singulisphaera rosea]